MPAAPATVGAYLASLKDSVRDRVAALIRVAPFKLEAYFFIALIYFIFCFAMSRYSAWVEKQVNKGKMR